MLKLSVERMLKNQNLPVLKKRSSQSHKGDFGKILIISGSRGMTGAGVLTAKAALRSGAGLVVLAIPESEQRVVASQSIPEIITHPLPATEEGTLSLTAQKNLISLSESFDVIAIGPGLSQHPETRTLIKQLMRLLSKPMVIDADAITALSKDLKILKKQSKSILTPHPLEFAKLIQKDLSDVFKDHLNLAINFCKEYPVTLALKTAPAIVLQKDNFYKNTSGNPGMATAGSGDVLTGIIAALLGQNLTSFDAASLGVFIHGLAGDLAVRKKGEISLIASDIIKELPQAFKKYQGITS